MLRLSAMRASLRVAESSLQTVCCVWLKAQNKTKAVAATPGAKYHLPGKHGTVHQHDAVSGSVMLCTGTAVYTVLREAEHRSTAPIAYWEFPGAKQIIPRQRDCVQALQVRFFLLESGGNGSWCSILAAELHAAVGMPLISVP
eukprot:1150442-Pelagomonas_calceolata.AAC.4